MQQFSDLGNPGVYTNGPAVITAGTGTVEMAVWCPTARSPNLTGTGVTGSKYDKAIRTNTNCFMRGLKETVELKTNSGLAWQWRRICFTLKGDTLNLGINDLGTSPVARETSDGTVRLLHGDSTTVSRAVDLVFKGENGVDWSNHFIAPLDTKKIKVYYDRTRNLMGGNARGHVHTFKQWYPMNKNLYYEDDEIGDEMQDALFSVENRQGMGDYYIYDLFYAPTTGGTETDTLSVQMNARLYWHEK